MPSNKVIVFLIVTLYNISSLQLHAQDKREEETFLSYSVVVGTFRLDENAKAFCENIVAKGFDASIQKDSVSALNYVSVGRQVSKEEAIDKVLSIRLTNGFETAWIRPVRNAKMLSITNSIPELAENIHDSETGKVPEQNSPIEFNPVNTEVFLHLYNAANDKLIDGTVHVVDTERSRLIEKAKGNSYYQLPDPKSKSKRITLIGDVFGYRKTQTEISYPLSDADSENTSIEMVGTITMIRFDMVRYAKGEINVLYNVYFFNDASVMQPESRYELNNLLDMMNENPNYKIRLHGHSNGNYTGKIFEPADSNNLFTFLGATESFGTAKELSLKRAEVIKTFLTTNGIAENRIEVKPWGGKKPLYDKNSANAKKNVRVEVEIMQD